MAIRDIGVRTVIENLQGFLSGMDRYNQSLKTAEQRTQQFAERAGKTGRALIAVSAPLIAIGALSIRTFASFEQSMARVQAVTGATAEEMEELLDVARRMGQTTVFSAREAAGALAFMAQAGLTVQEQITALPEVLNLAAAGQLELATAADIVTNILAGQRLEAEDLANATDVLVTAFTSANTNLVQLGQAFKFAGPVATAAGIAFEEQAAVLSFLGDAGIQASLAGTSLRGAIGRLINPSNEASKTLERLGVVALDSSGQMRPLADIIDELIVGGAQAADIMEIFGLRAGPAMLQLLSVGGDAIREFTRDLQDAGGTAQRVAEVQIDTLRGDLTLMTSAAEGAQISIGEALAPALRALSRALVPVLNFIALMAEKFPLLTAVVIGGAVVMGVLGIALVGLSLILPGLQILFVALGGGMGIAAIGAGALSFALSPIGLIALGIAAAIVAVILVFKNWATIVDFVSAAFGRLIEFLKDAVNLFLRLSPLTQVLRLTPLGGFGGIPQFEHGGIQQTSGMAIVGERGPELVQLPAGAQVMSNSRSTTFNINANYSNRQDPQTIRLDLEAIDMMTRS